MSSKREIVSLEEIWNTTLEELKDILNSNGYESQNLQYDRALLAMIYYNQNRLHSGNTWAVTHPDFLAVVGVASDLNVGLRQLLTPFSERLILFHGYFRSATSEVDDLSSYSQMRKFKYWLYDDHMNELLGTNSYPWEKLTMLKDLHVYPMVKEISGYSRENLDYLEGELDLPDYGPPGATRAQEIRFAEILWAHFLSYESRYRKELEAYESLEDVYNPHQIIDDYLHVSMTCVHPLVKCFYLFSMWELNEIFPRPDIGEKILSELTSYGDLIVSDVPTAVFPDIIVSDLRPLVQAYVGLPSRQTFIARLIERFNKGMVYDISVITDTIRDLDIFDRILISQGHLIIQRTNETHSDQANYINYTQYVLGDPWVKEYFDYRNTIPKVWLFDGIINRHVFDVYGRDRSMEFGLPAWPGK